MIQILKTLWFLTTTVKINIILDNSTCETLHNAQKLLLTNNMLMLTPESILEQKLNELKLTNVLLMQKRKK